jgi:nicotinamide mononucleotide transporter
VSNPVEVAANLINALSIAAAARRSVHTWWTGIIGCLLFAWVFVQARLYADACLQGFFIVSSALGWWRWRRAEGQRELPVSHAPLQQLGTRALLGALVTAAYAWTLQRFTDAAAPLPDTAVLTTSVLGQLLLVEKRVESWYFWLAANSIAVPLYISRDLHLTALLYAAFWVNAIIALRRWKRLARPAPGSSRPHTAQGERLDCERPLERVNAAKHVEPSA